MSDKTTYNEDHFETLMKALCGWYVRRDKAFYSVKHLDRKLSSDDVKRTAILRFKSEHADIPLETPLLKAVFDIAITKLHTDPTRMLPVWDGGMRCEPTNDGPFIWDEGMVTVNAWRMPNYRAADINDREIEVVQDYLKWMFPRHDERTRIIDWLAWCLQNEGNKPMWAPLLYSATKGSGKSTFCMLAQKLFGDDNTAALNGVDKLTGRFNVTPLLKKLVTCEEVSLRPDSVQGNTLKTFITEGEVLAERKGQESAPLRQCCCFLLTTNHFPSWIETDDRRYWIVDVDHDGHASGKRGKDFADLVGQLREAMDDPAFLRSVYNWLMRRQLTEGFTALTLNLATDSTDIMRRVHSSSEQVMLVALREYLASLGCFAIPQEALCDHVMKEMKMNPNALRHMMAELGWHGQDVKWSGKDYARRVWVHGGYTIHRGQLSGPEGYEAILTDLETFKDFTGILQGDESAPIAQAAY